MRIIVTITGATGAVYGALLLAALREPAIESRLVLGRSAKARRAEEAERSARELAFISSHSLHRNGMVPSRGVETPDNRNISALSRMEAVIAPAVPALHSHPKTLDEARRSDGRRTLDPFELEWPSLRRPKARKC